jgi:hypothetical protein
VLVAFMIVIAVNQMGGLPLRRSLVTAAQYYNVSDLSIGLFVDDFYDCLLYIISIPASWIIDTYGIRVAVGIGAA